MTPGGTGTMGAGGPVVTVDISLPAAGVTIQGTWRPNEAERAAAWDLCVELCTRVPVIPIRDGEGLLDEALAGLHALFAVSRDTLRRHGPAVAEARRGELSLAVIVGQLLNQVLRPIAAYGQPWLDARSAERAPGSPGTGAADRDGAGDALEARILRAALDDLRPVVVAFATTFARACGAEEFLRTQMEHEDRLHHHYARLVRRGPADGAPPAPAAPPPGA